MQFEVGKIYDGTVKGITQYGAFVELDKSTTGMVHISEIANTYVSDIKEYLKENQAVKVKVLGVNEAGKISLSIKKAIEPSSTGAAHAHNNGGGNNFRKASPRQNVWEPRKQPPVTELTFEDMLSKFKQNSEEKMGDIKRNIENKRKSSSRRGR